MIFKLVILLLEKDSAIFWSIKDLFLVHWTLVDEWLRAWRFVYTRIGLIYILLANQIENFEKEGLAMAPSKFKDSPGSAVIKQRQYSLIIMICQTKKAVWSTGNILKSGLWAVWLTFLMEWSLAVTKLPIIICRSQSKFPDKIVTKRSNN